MVLIFTLLLFWEVLQKKKKKSTSYLFPVAYIVSG